MKDKKKALVNEGQDKDTKEPVESYIVLAFESPGSANITKFVPHNVSLPQIQQAGIHLSNIALLETWWNMFNEMLIRHVSGPGGIGRAVCAPRPELRRRESMIPWP